MLVEKKNGIVTYNGIRSDSYNPKHLNCSALLPTKLQVVIADFERVSLPSLIDLFRSPDGC